MALSSVAGQNAYEGRSTERMTSRAPAPQFDALPIEELLGALNDFERKNAPPRLYYAGNLQLVRAGRRVSIVGSRKASQRGLTTAADLARALVARGVVVVSGLAEGIDAAAHQAALDAGGHTVGVLGTPLDQSYPAKNRALQNRLMREQLVVSQFEPGSVVVKKNFPDRNRTMALLSDATVIVEAGEKSGSLHQGWEAIRLGRPLFVMEQLMLDPSLTWPTEFKHYGAAPLSPAHFDSLIEVLPEQARGEVSEFAF